MKFRKGVLRAACALLISWVPPTTFAAEQIKVTLSNSGDETMAEAGVISVYIKNVGDAPASIYAMKTPFAINDERLANPQFEVKDSFGREMRYVGRNVKPGPISPSSFIVLQPGQVISKNVDIASDYDLKEGAYSVSFHVDLSTRPEAEEPNGLKSQDVPVNTQKEASSNTLNLWITPSLLEARKRKSSSFMSANEQQSVCSAAQVDELGSVVSAAASQSYTALNYLGSTYQWTYDGSGMPISVNNTDPRYMYWFGTYDTSIPPSDPNSLYTDNAQVDQIMLAAYYRLANESFSFECGCDPVKYPAETRAWAESSNPYHMHICDSFWGDPLAEGLSSKVGTMVHETTHFNDAHKEGTLDYAYGPTTVHNLTLTDRSKAVRNADNYEFYIMDSKRQ